MSEEGVSGLEHTSIKTSQTEEQREKNGKKKKNRISPKFRTTTKGITLHIMEIPGKETREKGKEEIFEV